MRRNKEIQKKLDFGTATHSATTTISKPKFPSKTKFKDLSCCQDIFNKSKSPKSLYTVNITKQANDLSKLHGGELK